MTFVATLKITELVELTIDTSDLELNLSKRQKVTGARFALKASKLLSTF